MVIGTQSMYETKVMLKFIFTYNKVYQNSIPSSIVAFYLPLADALHILNISARGCWLLNGKYSSFRLCMYFSSFPS